MGKVKQQKLDFDENFDDCFQKRRKLNNFLLQQQEEEDRSILHVLVSSNKAIGVLKDEKEKLKNLMQIESKEKFGGGNINANWSDNQSSEVFNICRETFNFVLNIIQPFIIKLPTNSVPNPIDTEKQLGLTFYCLAHGCSIIVIYLEFKNL